MNKLRSNKGITLVALIITIIILLVLATVSINLVMNGGIIDKSKSAIDKYSEEEIGEQIKLAYLECQTEKLSNSNINEEDFLTTSLKKTFGNDNVKNVSVTNGKILVEIRTKGDFVKYSYNSKTGISEIVEKWKQGEDGSYSKGKTIGVQVGDIVHYETILNKTENVVDSEKLAELKSDLATYSGANSNDSDNSSIDRDSLTWKVLDIKDGKMRLISAVPTTKKIKLNNYNGYNNAVYLIDKVCDTLYSANEVGKAQNLKIEDIEGVLTYDYTQFADYWSDKAKYGSIEEYTESLQYPKIYSSEVGCKAISAVDNTGNTLGLSEQTSPVTGGSTASSRLVVTQTCWYKSMDSSDFTDSKYYTLFINNGLENYPPYLLSSRCVFCDGFVTFYIRIVDSGKVSQYRRLRSDGYVFSRLNLFIPSSSYSRI